MARFEIGLIAVAFVLPVAVFAAGGGATAAQQQEEIDRWFRARVEEQLQGAARPGSERLVGPGGLWRSRGAADVALPEFVPPTSLAPLIRAVSPGVVNISTSNEGPSERASVPVAGAARQSLGSGFIISPDGNVVTNNHVVERAQRIRVQLADGRELEARVTGRDPTTDLALLRIEGDFGGELPFVYLGDSDRLEVGDWVVAIGNPFGLDHSVSHGMISAKERVLGIGIFDDFIQTDALINPGNSGGPLFNMRGEVVGVNTAIISQGQGIGFAVPIALVKDLLPNLLENGRLARGWLGVHILEQTSEDGVPGAVVKEVFRGSPAAEAGLLPGDRVVAANGRPIETYLQLLRRVSVLAPGSEVQLTVVRGDKKERRDVVVRLVERPAPEAMKALAETSQDSRELGLVMRELTPELAQSAGVPRSSGLWIAGVIPGGPAERAGLRAGDIVTEVNRHKVATLEAYRAALARTPAEGPVLIRVQRGDVGRYVAVPR